MTPAIRALERAKVAFSVHAYVHDPAAESFGEEVVQALALDPARTFKTLVARLDGTRLTLALVPVSAKLNLKQLASACGVKKADMADPALAERTTGYVVGGISPLAGRKALPAVIDDSALGFPTIFVSAGKRGLQLELNAHDLVRLTGATPACIATH